MGVTGIDMESSCMLTLGRLMGVKTCILTMVTVLENLKEKLTGQERTDAEDRFAEQPWKESIIII